VQTFDTDMFRLFGQITGDPDFDLLRITVGTGFGLPSPGHTTLTQLPGGTWSVDSFFDITYRIDFVGAPGGPLGGMSGSTTGTIRLGASGNCAQNPALCDDANPCTADQCDLQTGQCVHGPVSCDDGDACTTDGCNPQGSTCDVPDNGTGTATLPPPGCAYEDPNDDLRIIDGLPPGTTIEMEEVLASFSCPAIGTVCSFVPPIPGVDCDQPGGSLGGEQECATATLAMNLTGTGTLAGYARALNLPVGFESHSGPRTPGMPVQSFPTDMFRFFGQITGDPDFDLLRITAGTDFGLPSPGHTTLTQLPGGTWAVDSFFDITYRIDFVGAPGGPLAGRSGSTTGTIRLATGGGGCVHRPLDCDDGDACTIDSCDPVLGCLHEPVSCDDLNPCTTDYCDPRGGQCVNLPVDCDDANPCTADRCDLQTGQCIHDPIRCDDGNACTQDVCEPQGTPCQVPDNGTGTATLPPQGCGYEDPNDDLRIIDGLPPGTTVEMREVLSSFSCPAMGAVCSFAPPVPGVDCDQPGGSLGGEQECADAILALSLTGTGALAGYARALNLPVSFESHAGPRMPGMPVQTFDTDMFRLFGQITGDPDFDLLRIVAGTDFGLPSPGHTTLAQLPGGNWAVDSFFDITYRIDFVGKPGGPFSGMSGSTTGTIRLATGGGGCVHRPLNCDDGDACTIDSCDPRGSTCDVPDNGTGTATLPPQGCGYEDPSDDLRIVDGLPPGTTVEMQEVLSSFSCPAMGAVCSFAPPIPGVDCDQPGGSLGGEQECADGVFALNLTGTGSLAGYARALNLPVGFESHAGPRTPGMPVQTFDTDMFRLFGQITGDPDFDLLRIVAGTDFGLPSPGHTTLVQLPGGNWAVDSFFDITYRIDFVGAPGGPLAGMSGSTTGTIRLATGGGGCAHQPVDCDDADPCTDDWCDPRRGCMHAFNAAPCDDGDGCTTGDVCSNGVCAGTAGLPPGEASDLGYGTPFPPSDKQTVSWTAAPGAVVHDVVRGAIHGLPVGPGGLDEVCFADLAGTALVDPATPSVGTGFFYVARGENACGAGTWGNTHFNPGPALNGPPRLTATCP
jgi:hypothetical protein